MIDKVLSYWLLSVCLWRDRMVVVLHIWFMYPSAGLLGYCMWRSSTRHWTMNSLDYELCITLSCSWRTWLPSCVARPLDRRVEHVSDWLRLSLHADVLILRRVCVETFVGTYFYPRDAMLARVIEIATCPSVCVFVRPSVRHAPVLCQNEES